MSNVGLQMAPEDRAPKGSKHRVRAGVAVLMSIGVVVLLVLGVRFGISALSDLRGPADYVGDGTDPVEVTVLEGQTLAEMGRTLKDAGVVASVDAWLDACEAEPESMTIGPGLYDMRLEMSAEAAVDRMIDPASRITDKLLLREGLRFTQSIDTISEATGIPKQKLLDASTSGKIGLPDYAKDNAEGFLFPATYELDKDESAADVLSRLVDRWDKAAEKVDLQAGAKSNGVSAYEAMIIASLIQAEGHVDDYDKISRVIYNRLDPDTWGGTYGLLQMDATVNYALDKSEINLTTEELQNTESPYNTYIHPGLPPTPINSPGEAAMKAAVNPADGPWLYYVTVNPDTGETKFTDDYDEFLQFKAELSAWHEANPE